MMAIIDGGVMMMSGLTTLMTKSNELVIVMADELKPTGSVSRKVVSQLFS